MSEMKHDAKKPYTVSLEDHFLYPKAWELFSEHLKVKYELMKDSLVDVGENRIKMMDAAGLDFQVLSHVEPCLSLVDNVQEAVRFAREINDYLCDAISKNPKRLGGFAVLPMQSPEEATK